MDERAAGEVENDVAKAIKQVTFPFEHHAEVLGEYKEQRAALRSIYTYMAAAAVLMFLLTQAMLRSWTLAALSLLGVPIAVLGGLAATAMTGDSFALGSLLGLGAVLALTVRQGIDLVAHFQHLQLHEGEPFGEALVRRGVREKFSSIVASSVTTLVLVLPFAILGDMSWSRNPLSARGRGRRRHRSRRRSQRCSSFRRFTPALAPGGRRTGSIWKRKPHPDRRGFVATLQRRNAS